MTADLLIQIKQANQNFLAGTPSLVDEKGAPFIVLACIDARLTCMLEAAMGLPRNRAIVIRTAGNRITGDNRDIFRSVAVGVYMKRAAEIFVVGHTDCALSQFSAPEVIESFRCAGVPRSAFGDEDLRSWFGAFGDVRNNVVEGIQNLRRSGVVPACTRIHGLLLDTAGGGLEVLWDGNVSHEDIPHPDAAASSPPETAAKSVTIPDVLPPPKGKARTGHEQTPPPMSMKEIAALLKHVLAQERRRPEFQRGMAELMPAVREKDPVRALAVLEMIFSRCQSEYPELRPAFESLRKSMGAKGAAGFDYVEFIRRLLQ